MLTVVDPAESPQTQHDDVTKRVSKQVLLDNHRQTDVNNARRHDNQPVDYLKIASRTCVTS